MLPFNEEFADVNEYLGLFSFPLVCSQQRLRDEQRLLDCLLYRLNYSCQFILVVLFILLGWFFEERSIS